jgi:hypothetical protein
VGVANSIQLLIRSIFLLFLLLKLLKLRLILRILAPVLHPSNLCFQHLVLTLELLLALYLLALLPSRFHMLLLLFIALLRLFNAL